MKPYLGLVLAAVLLALALANQLDDDLKTATADCQKLHQVEETEYRNMISGKIPSADSSENLRCWIRCVMEKFDVMDPATSAFRPDVLRTIFRDSPSLNQALQKCEALDDEEPCEKAFAITVCVMMDIFSRHK